MLRIDCLGRSHAQALQAVVKAQFQLAISVLTPPAQPRPFLQTLYCGNTVHDQYVQVTSSAVRLVDCTTSQLVTEWRPPAGTTISVAAGSPAQVSVASWLTGKLC